MSRDSFAKAPDLGSALGIAVDQGSKPMCRIDYDRYRDLFDDPALSDAQKDQMIEALVHIGLLFYDAGFGFEVDGEACGKRRQCDDDSAAETEDMVSSTAITLSKLFNLCAA